MQAGVQGPQWDLTSEYNNTDDPKIDADRQAIDAHLAKIEGLNSSLTGAAGEALIEPAQQVFKLNEEVSRLVGNLSTYASCRLSVNSRDEAAQKLQGGLKNVIKRAGEAAEPLSQFTLLADDELIEKFLADPVIAPARFITLHRRARRHELLSLKEESLVHSLASDGIHAWGDLYDQLSGTLRCDVLLGNETVEMGIAEAAGLLQKPEVETRKAAWQAINESFSEHEEACAAAINAIAGWRLEMGKKRSTTRPVHYLDAPVHANRFSREVLDALMACAQEARPLAQAAAGLQARAYGETCIGPWDVRAPAPGLADAAARSIPFTEACDVIRDAYGRVDGSMADFVQMMIDNRWVEGTVADNKRPGAYCTTFSRSRNPRVYMTYTGGASDVITLAHELGHAYHSWVMRDLPDSQRSYGMSLAETASTFGETVVRNALLERAESPAEKLGIVWEEMSALVAFVLNIPTRFEFETRLYDQRAQRPLRPAELCELMESAWSKWYGDVLDRPDPMFWASKLHFYISGLSFYNFPYLFGYLFSLGVYSHREQMGDQFFPHYVDLLRDTGRMSASDLAARHLKGDLCDASFWRASIDQVRPRVKAFEQLLDELSM
ncbi:MAG: M3 family oligoendopeptidase [Proteobacteria bacterium]|nr:M3 family oligoendopeptidase [Pseudomonadota bacterium]